MPSRTHSGFCHTSSSIPDSVAMRSRNSYMAWNFQVVSTWRSGNGGGDGANALRARCSIVPLSLPIEYSITGRSDSATASRMMGMLPASSRCRWLRSRPVSTVSVTGTSSLAQGVGSKFGRSYRGSDLSQRFAGDFDGQMTPKSLRPPPRKRWWLPSLCVLALGAPGSPKCLPTSDSRHYFADHAGEPFQRRDRREVGEPHVEALDP